MLLRYLFYRLLQLTILLYCTKVLSFNIGMIHLLLLLIHILLLLLLPLVSHHILKVFYYIYQFVKFPVVYVGTIFSLLIHKYSKLSLIKIFSNYLLTQIFLFHFSIIFFWIHFIYLFYYYLFLKKWKKHRNKKII